MDNAQIIRDAVRKKAQIITGLNRSVWEYAELGYQETKSAAATKSPGGRRLYSN